MMFAGDGLEKPCTGGDNHMKHYPKTGKGAETEAKRRVPSK